MKKLTAMLLVLVMALSLIACGETTNPGGSEPKDDVKTYVWDVTVVFDSYDAKGGEVPPTVTLTEKANSANTLFLDPLAALGSVEGDVIDFTPLLDEDNNVVLDGELKTVSATFNEADWTVSDNNRGSIFTYEVVSPLTEGDYETHGELLITAKAPDYIWDVTVVFGPGTEGTYEFTNPGLEGWGAPYESQMNVVTPEDNTFELYVFNHSNWIVDNVATWYQWVVFDVDDVAPVYTYTITKHLTMGDRQTHGELTINISLPE